jgi:hypothetical protein
MCRNEELRVAGRVSTFLIRFSGVSAPVRGKVRLVPDLDCIDYGK